MANSILELAMRHDLTLDICPYSVEVVWVDASLSESHVFREHCDTRAERLAALRRCVEKAIERAARTRGDEVGKSS